MTNTETDALFALVLAARDPNYAAWCASQDIEPATLRSPKTCEASKAWTIDVSEWQS